MKKLVTLLLIAACASGSLFAQSGLSEDGKFRFGVQTSPFFSFMGTNDNQIESDGSNIGFELGLIGELYISDNLNYAITSGLSLTFNQGGTLLYTRPGVIFNDSELNEVTIDSLAEGTSVNYKLQYLEIPFGFKMRTDEFGAGGDIRAFANLPVFTIGIPTQSRGDISGPNAEGSKENISKDIFPLSLSWGLGGGVEYQVTDAVSLVGGVYYQSGLLDVTNNDGVYTDNGEAIDANNRISRVTIRIGVMF